MRVLHVFKTYIPDSFAGIERVIWQVAEGCAELGIDSEVLSLSRNPEANSMSVGRHFAAKAKLLVEYASTGLSIDFICELRKRARAADIVHYHFPWPMMDLAHLLVRPNRPTVVTYHSDIVRQKRLEKLYAPLRTAFLNSVDAVVATSPNYLQSSQVLQKCRARTSVIPIGLNSGQSRVAPEQLAHWRARLGHRFFLFVGALRYYKGIQFLLEAARESGLPLVILGEGEMHDDIASAGLPNVKMIGAVSDEDKAALLQLCSAFVFPSHLRSEAFGVALLEAAFAGKAMISCELGTGTSYINIDGETGIVIPPADGAALASAMRTLWNDQYLCARYGEAAINRANAVFSASAMTERYIQLYLALLSDRLPASRHDPAQ